MTTSVRKWGNSLAVRIPQPIAEQANLKEGVNVSFTVSEEGSIILSPKPKYTLDELLEGVSPEHFEGETEWGEPVGKEVW
ncbi:AbrB/MazE/SpoVT family DNA-binding domain-containing protein [Euhalothece natronophila Z-M001]|uniref:AbrB/MazE/SpoVT family DNA-binding domain-containing protein n=1 Tax=Euhalothece natronophila Z-M001 TaxID=522448 RepID=A0A5B8NNS3_9CHRO|nr:AbrB/MazE/SpoVT family DNA-binding domain-containing protein [Euhalothece natronophila]QDZ40231.1 AbrB/MazE/SpoVT family DNA-binding domain-containing protein [Euhalothece natronophila Z-M001]